MPQPVDPSVPDILPRRPRPRPRRGRWSVLGPPALVLLLVIALLLVRGGPGASHPSLPAATVPPADLALTIDLTTPLPGDAFDWATVIRIIDGDTLDVGWAGREFRVRLYGIDTSEIGAACSQEASARLRTLLPPDSSVLLHPGPRNDDGQRLLRYLFLPQPRLSVDATLVHEGLATASPRDGQLQGPLHALERQARDAHRGCLWQAR